MINTDFLDDISRKVSSALPEGIKMMQQDVDKNIKAILQSSIEKMNLVSREEFDVQTVLLARTQERLQILEKQIEQLEKNS